MRSTLGRRPATMRGVKARCTRRRSRVWSGGSLFSRPPVSKMRRSGRSLACSAAGSRSSSGVWRPALEYRVGACSIAITSACRVTIQLRHDSHQ